MSLASALEAAAEALPGTEAAIRPANGDPERLLEGLAAEDAPKLLAWLLGHEADAGEELLGEWTLSERGAQAVLATGDEGLPKAARKALRRARHRLRGRGLTVEEQAPAPTVARLPTVKDDLETAAVSGLDPLGACLVYLVEQNPSGGARLFEIAVSESRGVFDARVYSGGRSKVRGFLREATDRGGMSAVPAEPEAVRSLIARAAAAHPADRPLPPDFRDWRSHLTGDAGAPTPAEQARAALEPADPSELSHVLARIEAGVLGPWAPGEVLQGAAEKLRELGESLIIVSPAQRKSQADEILSEALEAAYGGEGGRAAAACFAHAAYVAWRRGEEEEARELLAASGTFAAGPAAQNAVARALLERPLSGLLGKLAEERLESESESLIVKPGEPAGSPGARSGSA